MDQQGDLGGNRVAKGGKKHHEHGTNERRRKMQKKVLLSLQVLFLFCLHSYYSSRICLFLSLITHAVIASY